MFEICIGQTDLLIGCDSDLSKTAERLVMKVRSIIASHIEKHQIFEKSLEPVNPDPAYHKVINEMIEAAAPAGTGPMAAVAGAISQYVGEGLLKFSRQVFIENGGDIYFASDSDRVIGIYAGGSPLSNKVGIKLSKDIFPAGICTSSGTVGHSLSFGRADAVTVVSKNAYLADAVATATGNMVKESKDIKKAVDFASGIEGVDGIVAIIGDRIGAAGRIELVAL
jgi:hypothetical protein